ncbi:hypothetical protein BD413DRAFT_89470 [Trametes elegans]|nr:hypothetical protein BD413DRAFT_89470 [Trametes elegans]
MAVTPQNAMLGMLAALRAARRTNPDMAAHPIPDDGSNGLVEMLRNADFLPPELRTEARADEEQDDDDDLPALEDDIRGNAMPTPSSVHTPSTLSVVHSTEEDLDADDDLPPLESVLSSSPTPVVDVHSSIVSADGIGSHSATTASNLSGTSLSTHEQVRLVDTTPESSRRSRRATVASVSSTDWSTDVNEEGGADSDASMPTLRTVSDSSSDDDDGDQSLSFDSDSDEWYTESEDDSLDDSDEEIHTIPNPTISPLNSTADRSLRPVLSELIAETPSDVPPSLASFQALLERARSVIPDLDDRLWRPPEEMLADLAHHIARIGPVEDDPQRAEALLAGMEFVPDDLVHRYEKLRMSDGEDGDGCAICRDDLLDKSSGAAEAANVVTVFAALPFHPDADAVVAFPCSGKHLFHSSCIAPWLSRKTTCPSCRFDIDPYSLTLRRFREPFAESSSTTPGRVWRPPQVESMRDWLDAEERARELNKPRVRPPVVMPTYPAATSEPTSGDVLGSFGDSASPPTVPPSGPFLSDFLDSRDMAHPPFPSAMHIPPVFAPANVGSAMDPGLSPTASRVELIRAELARIRRSAPFSPSPPSAADEPPEFVAPAPTDFRRETPYMVSMPMPPPPPEHVRDSLVETLQTMHSDMQSDTMSPWERTPEMFEAMVARDFGRVRMDSHESELTLDGPWAQSTRAMLPTPNVVPATSTTPGPANTPHPQPVGASSLPHIHATVLDPGNAFDSGYAPPPIQADPNQSLTAVAPLFLDADYMQALLSSGLVEPINEDPPAEVQNPRGDDLDDLD